MKKELLDLVEDLIEANARELMHWESVGNTGQIEYYRGKLAAYQIIEDYAK
jgi:hypothetical protein